MLHILPVELSLAVLSYLPLSTLCPSHSVSRKWLNFFSQNQSTIFHNAAILHGYTHHATLLLEDALSTHQGDPWEGATDWKDFCKLYITMPLPCTGVADSESPVLVLVLVLGRRSHQLHMNWEGNGRVVARLLRPPGSDVHRLKVDEKAGILITTHILGGLSVTHLFSGVLLWSLPRVRSSHLYPTL
jgi:F-box associated protein